MQGHALRARNTLRIVCFCSAVVLLGDAFYLQAKALLAQHLISTAWQRGAVESPWPWADTHPRARLQSPAQAVDLFVLDGTHDATLAFGPGWQRGTANDTVILSAHRDTHFAFLQDLQLGDELWLSERPRTTQRYRVAEITVVDSNDGPIAVDSNEPVLLLTTCYPFDALMPGGSKRFVVVAYPENHVDSNEVVEL